MATTSKKRGKAEALIIIAIFIVSAFVAGLAVVRDAGGELQDYVIAGDTVYIDDAKVFLSATPHTLNMSGWVEYHLISKLYTGEIDVAFGFNQSKARPLNVELWVGGEWVAWDTAFTRVDYDAKGMDRWYVAYNKTVGAGNEYALRVWIELPFATSIVEGEPQGEYLFAVKPSGKTIKEASAVDQLYYLDPWWDLDFTHRVRLVFDNSGQTEDLINFPVLVNLTASNFEDFTVIRSEGQDIRFIDNDNSTVLHHEIEFINATTEQAFIWVEVPQIDGASNSDRIWMYYGNITAADGQDVEGTWNANFMMVHHLQEDTNATLIDSTGNDNDGVPYPFAAPPVSVVSQINSGLDFDGVSTYLNVSHSASLNPANITIEFWTKFTPNSDIHIDKRNSTGHGFGYVIDWSAAQFKISIAKAVGASDTAEVVSTPDNTAFTYWVSAHNGSAIKIYLNGTKRDDDSATAAFIFNTEPLIIGTRFTNTTSWTDAVLDEIRISNISRSDDWIAAQYLSMTSQFITVGAHGHPAFSILFTQTGIPATIFMPMLTINGTVYDVQSLPVRFNGSTNEVVTYEYVNPVAASLNLEYIFASISGGNPVQTLRGNTFMPEGNTTVTAVYGSVGNPVFPIIFIGVFVAILLAVLGFYLSHKKKGK